MATTLFDHEKLRVYQASLEFIVWLNSITDKIPKSLSVFDQLDRASTSIPLNIAEGNGKYHSKDRCRYFDIARASALECAACLDVLTARSILTAVEAVPGKNHLHSIVSMMVTLIKKNSSERVYEDDAVYKSKADQDYDQDQEQE